MVRSSLPRIAWSLVFVIVAGCTSANDAVTPATESIGSVPVVATPAGSLVPVESVTPGQATSGPTTAAAVGDEIEAKDVRTRADDAVGDGVRPEGFTTVAAAVTSAEGEVCIVCLWLADVADERSRGLMGVTDLGDAVGMAFVFDAPSEAAFVMIGTPTPLSIAWFDATGGHVSSLDMEPCVEEDPADCERYRAQAAYTVAIEMFQGELDAIGIGAGSTVELLAGTESVECADGA